MGEKKKEGGAHKALYRKYRSKSLSEVIGQEHVTKTLENALKQGKVAHAYLFTGPRGTGKTSIARILAHEVNQLPYEDEKTHLDIIEIDAASNRRIDDIRDLRDKVHIAPVSAKYKVYIIDEVHMLTTESFNALLKTLEEPPEHVIFMLATTEVHKLPATIISRTQRHSLHLIPGEKVAAHLKTIAQSEGITISDEALALLAEHGGGSFRDSISLLDQMSASEGKIDTDFVELLLGLAPKQSIQSLLQSTQNGESKQIVQQLEQLFESGMTPAGIATQLIEALRTQAKEAKVTTADASLMRELLSVSSAQFPELKLEICLLGASPTQAQPAPAAAPITTPQSAASAPAPKVKDVPAATAVKTFTAPEPKIEAPVVEDQESEAPKETTEVSKKPKPAPGAFSLENDWLTILELIKKENGPLYTALRLATPTLEGSTLELAFAFPFHQKKLDEPKYKSLLVSCIAKQAGVEVQVRSIVDKSKASGSTTSPLPAAPPVVNDAHASLISNVQDIMGGGEVVNV